MINRTELIKLISIEICLRGPQNPYEIGANGGPYWKRYQDSVERALSAIEGAGFEIVPVSEEVIPRPNNQER